MERKEIVLDGGKKVSYVGPDIAEGPLPSFFYFALSEEESLLIDPYNQPAQFLMEKPMRTFSFSIPGHGPDLDPRKAIGIWADEFKKGNDILTPFIEMCAESIQEMHELGLLPNNKIATGGLSRGAFIAAHIAARVPEITHLLGFAPLTQLNMTNEFVDLENNALAKSLNLENIADEICGRNIRFYIGNRDLRVGTDRTFSLVKKLSERAFEKGIRSSPIEMIITPSIGHMGHGTAQHVFKKGMDWLTGAFHC